MCALCSHLELGEGTGSSSTGPGKRVAGSLGSAGRRLPAKPGFTRGGANVSPGPVPSAGGGPRCAERGGHRAGACSLRLRLRQVLPAPSQAATATFDVSFQAAAIGSSTPPSHLPCGGGALNGGQSLWVTGGATGRVRSVLPRCGRRR